MRCAHRTWRRMEQRRRHPVYPERTLGNRPFSNSGFGWNARAGQLSRSKAGRRQPSLAHIFAGPNSLSLFGNESYWPKRPLLGLRGLIEFEGEATACPNESQCCLRLARISDLRARSDSFCATFWPQEIRAEWRADSYSE